jgi:hypothetical protein
VCSDVLLYCVGELSQEFRLGEGGELPEGDAGPGLQVSLIVPLSVIETGEVLV